MANAVFFRLLQEDVDQNANTLDRPIADLSDDDPPVTIKPLGRLIGAFKVVTARAINEAWGTPDAPVWQRNFYEHIIRIEAALDRIRQYIVNNPARWSEDAENTSRPR
jgi:hypothetical protein